MKEPEAGEWGGWLGVAAEWCRHRPEQVRFRPGHSGLCAALDRDGRDVVVDPNASGPPFTPPFSTSTFLSRGQPGPAEGDHGCKSEGVRGWQARAGRKP